MALAHHRATSLESARVTTIGAVRHLTRSRPLQWGLIRPPKRGRARSGYAHVIDSSISSIGIGTYMLARNRPDRRMLCGHRACSTWYPNQRQVSTALRASADQPTSGAFGRGTDGRGSSLVRGHLAEGGRPACSSKSRAGDGAVNRSAITKACSQHERNTKAA